MALRTSRLLKVRKTVSDLPDATPSASCALMPACVRQAEILRQGQCLQQQQQSRQSSFGDFFKRIKSEAEKCGLLPPVGTITLLLSGPSDLLCYTQKS